MTPITTAWILAAALATEPSVTVSYTADNAVRAVRLVVGEHSTDLKIGANAVVWKSADTLVIPLKKETEHFLVFEVENLGKMDRLNPAGFLAAIDAVGLVCGFADSGARWEIAVPSDGPPKWSRAVPYAPNAAPSLWAQSGAVDGIRETAMWVWSAGNFREGGDNRLLVRTRLSTAGCQPAGGRRPTL